MFNNEKEPTIKELVEVAENEKLVIPEFQREFVWERNQIKLLIDSIYNQYTISSILTWEGTGELARRRVGGSMKEIKTDTNGAKITYLLDGQQRTTALLLIFTDKPVYKRKNMKKKEDITLYFDSKYSDEDPELRFVYNDEIIEVDGKEITLNEFSDKELFTKYGIRFIKLKEVYKQSQNKINYSTIKELIEDEKLRYEYIQSLSKLQNDLLNKKVVRIDQPGELSAVLDIFSRINTLNTKLNIFDIMVAKTYKKFGERYFDLRTFLKMVNYAGKIKADYFQNIDELDLSNTDMVIDDEEFQLFLILIMLKKEFKQKPILKLSTDIFKNNLKEIHKTYWELISFVENNFNVKHCDLSSIKPMLKFLCAMLSDTSPATLEKNNFLKTWFWNTLLYNRYPGAQNEKVLRDYNEYTSNGIAKAIAAYKKERTRVFSTTYLEAYYGDRSQLKDALLILMYYNQPKDFYDGIIPVKDSNVADRLEEHHIFPTNSKIVKEIKSNIQNPDELALFDNIVNIALITRKTNNDRISNKNPKDYITEFEKEYKKQTKLDEFYKIMESQFITKEMIEDLKKDDFFEFINKRTELIKKKIKELCD